MTDQPLDFDHPPTDPVALARNWFACADRESGLLTFGGAISRFVSRDDSASGVPIRESCQI